MPTLIRFMLYHAANGAALGCVLMLVASWQNWFGLGELLAIDTTGLATFLFYFQTVLTFAAANMGLAVMFLGEHDMD